LTARCCCKFSQP